MRLSREAGARLPFRSRGRTCLLGSASQSGSRPCWDTAASSLGLGDQEPCPRSQPCCQHKTCTQPPCPAWGRVTPSPVDAARAMAPALCRQPRHGASATGSSLIINGRVSGSAVPAGLCLPSADNHGPGGGRGLRSASRSSREGARCCMGTPLLSPALPRASGWGHPEGHPAATGMAGRGL